MPPSRELEAARQKWEKALKDANELALRLAKNGGNPTLICFLKNMEEFYNKNPTKIPKVVFCHQPTLTVYNQYKDAIRELQLAERT